MSLSRDSARKRLFLVVGNGNLRWASPRARFQKKERLGRAGAGSGSLVVIAGFTKAGGKEEGDEVFSSGVTDEVCSSIESVGW